MTVEGNTPYVALAPLSASDYRSVRLDTIFDHFKWDPQIGDTAVLTDFPLLLSDTAWRELSETAEKLAAEAIAAEQELLMRPDLHPTLDLPRAIRALWRKPDRVHASTCGDVRLIRFDFHYTTDGWQISEANIDTPGGLIEAAGFSQRMMVCYPGTQLTGNPGASLVQAIRRECNPGAVVALVHATAYADDRQIMISLNQQLEREGLRGSLISPAQLRWQEGQARIATDWQQDEVSHIVRFFPGEWLPNLPRRSGWQNYFTDCRVPASNPAIALLTQSKRFPLVWDKLKTPLATWRKLLPETRDPRDVRGEDADGWVYKPAFGRAGEDVVIAGVSSRRQWQSAQRHAHRHPGSWIAQRRFNAVALEASGKTLYPTLGVYTVNAKAAGIYARIAGKPLIDETAGDIAVFINSFNS